MLAIASQIVLCLVLAALLGLIIGYLLGRANCPKNAYRNGLAHDPHTTDDGDCDDAGEATDGSDEVSTDDNTGETADTDESTESDSGSSSKEEEAAAASTEDRVKSTANTEAQGLMQAVDENKTAKFEKDSDDRPEENAASEESAPKQAEEEPERAAEDNASTESEAAAVGEESEATSEVEEEEAPSDEDKPDTLLNAPRDGQKDNLTRIKGIGIKIEELLNGIGVYHFDQIAAWTEKEARWIDHKVAFPGRALRDDWIGQAKLLAEGKETEFSKRVDAGEVASSKKN